MTPPYFVNAFLSDGRAIMVNMNLVMTIVESAVESSKPTVSLQMTSEGEITVRGTYEQWKDRLDATFYLTTHHMAQENTP